MSRGLSGVQSKKKASRLAHSWRQWEVRGHKGTCGAFYRRRERKHIRSAFRESCPGRVLTEMQSGKKASYWLTFQKREGTLGGGWHANPVNETLSMGVRSKESVGVWKGSCRED